jgi:hypothetical protein
VWSIDRMEKKNDLGMERKDDYFGTSEQMVLLPVPGGPAINNARFALGVLRILGLLFIHI